MGSFVLTRQTKGRAVVCIGKTRMEGTQISRRILRRTGCERHVEVKVRCNKDRRWLRKGKSPGDGGHLSWYRNPKRSSRDLTGDGSPPKPYPAFRRSQGFLRTWTVWLHPEGGLIAMQYDGGVFCRLGGTRGGGSTAPQGCGGDLRSLWKKRGLLKKRQVNRGRGKKK